MKNKTNFCQKSTVKTQNQSVLTKRLRDKRIIFREKKNTARWPNDNIIKVANQKEIFISFQS